MNISYNQLKNYISPLPQVDELCEILTSLGLEVGGYETYESIKGGLQGLVIGEVLTCQKHPDADKLSVTTVNIGTTILPIVCGAPNVAKGQKVVVATVGTTLYSGETSFQIKKSKIRGEVSEGMICAEDEIGIGTSHAGIIVLPDETQIGTPAKDYYQAETDFVIEVDITANRTDAVSHFGVARDLYAYFKHRNTNISLTRPSVEKFAVTNTHLTIPVEIQTPEACKRYTGVTISGIEIKPSPEWLQNRLKAIGLNPINNIVDVTNFVMRELGQPLHAFDADQITDKKVVVKTVKSNTEFITLDNISRKLTDKDLMICNNNEAMCIAGVFGGAKSGVSLMTKNIFLESAYFDPIYVRKTSKHHGLQTDASFRFERGADPEITIYALKRAALLIQEVAGGYISSEIQDIYPEKIAPNRVELKFAHADRLIGKKIGHDIIKSILQSLEIQIVSESETSLILDVPRYRADVTREADVIEDILRIYGYNNVETPQAVRSTLAYSPKPDEYKTRNRVSEFLSAQGFSEAMSNSLTKGSYYSEGETFKTDESVKILNPLSSDLDVLRQTLLFNALEAVKRNLNYKTSDIAFYEFGHTYQRKNSTNSLVSGYTEEHRLAVVLSGNRNPINWISHENPTNFFLLKSKIDRIFELLNFQASDFQVTESEKDVYNYGLTYTFKNTVFAEFGAISNTYLSKFDIGQEVFYADLNWSDILANYNKSIRYKDISNFPKVRRDLALLLDDSIKFSDIQRIAFKTEKSLLREVSVFDVFRDKKLGENKKSYAVSFILQDDDKTLTDKQIDKIMSKLTTNFKAELNADLR